MNLCSVCNKNSVNCLYQVCNKCIDDYGTLDCYGESMTIFVKHSIIYSDINGVIIINRICSINDVPCCAWYINNELIFKKIKVKNTLSFGKLYTISE
jgi:hypothetical protein